jgi:hypothetical protein
VHHDDTSMRVLSLDRDADLSADRTGVSPVGSYGLSASARIAPFFTGCKHAGGEKTRSQQNQNIFGLFSTTCRHPAGR